MEILYQDKELVVCIKERGLLSQDGKEGEKTVPSELRKVCKGEIYPVHRLDKEVGGVMVFAVTKEAAASLSAQVSDRRMKKIYLTVVHGAPEKDEGEMEDLLYFDRSKNKSFPVKKERRGVKNALLTYTVKARGEGRTLVEVHLQTGRTHQIRVQFASRKMPLFGDKRYGAKDESRIIALWSYAISFIHPKTKERMNFKMLPEEEIFTFENNS